MRLIQNYNAFRVENMIFSAETKCRKAGAALGKRSFPAARKRLKAGFSRWTSSFRRKRFARLRAEKIKSAKVRIKPGNFSRLLIFRLRRQPKKVYLKFWALSTSFVFFADFFKKMPVFAGFLPQKSKWKESISRRLWDCRRQQADKRV